MAGGAPAADNTTTPSNGGGVNCNVSTSEGNNNENSKDSIAIDMGIWGADKASGQKEKAPKVMPYLFNTTKKTDLPQWIRPSVISIGPYNYDQKDFRRVQKLKNRGADRFIQESKQDREGLFKKIEGQTGAWRKFYKKGGLKKLTDGQLATIFLLDGCFLLDFIKYSWEEDGFKKLDLTNGEMANIKQDLFLLGNQLPYQVLRELLEGAQTSSDTKMETRIKDFVASRAPFSHIRIWDKIVVDTSECNHLLHYLCELLSQNPAERNSPPHQRPDEYYNCWGKCGELSADRRSCRTVQELLEVGISFKPSATGCLTDVTFNPHHLFGTTACLKLPTITMSTSTMITFLNIIAFESSKTTKREFDQVTSYLCFMDSLIDSWEDVKVLQAAGILRNNVGEPKDVAQFFNTVCSNLVPNPSAYRDVRRQIQSHADRHYNCTLKACYVQLIQKYFSSPWSCIALFAAIMGLSLAAVQAFTSVFLR